MTALALLGCIQPTGDYEDTCYVTSFNEYISSDSNVPTMCKLTVDCRISPDNFDEERHHELYLPQGVHLGNVVNKDGNLYYQNMPLASNALVAANKETSSYSKALYLKCNAPSGSYVNSCSVEVKNYISDDSELKDTGLCEAKIACKTSNDHKSSQYYELDYSSNIDGYKYISDSKPTVKYDSLGRIMSNVIYSNIKKSDDTTVQLIENCDGMLVIGSQDNQCKNIEAIKERAKAFGKSGRIEL